MTFKQFRNKPIVKILTNPYLLILFVFIIWMAFLDENSYLNHREFNKEINELNNEKEYYQSEINKDKELIKKLEKKEELEKFAREEYKMKKENEDIYLIEYDTLKK
ncbi:septum formation initiator family protein [Lutibacter sp. TH_r2]|uniref:septum formation initiator family protein n=1 Tax=Lutibacter sp. TH_r2 TaxID=3082083 RepID=UPI00295364F9|nr:septum formation initiator family protein [Lutibacter sp. TH_r2]MDV7185821.1 septum formation initiator family protein [Lutibacter sp. TH_r2]